MITNSEPAAKEPREVNPRPPTTRSAEPAGGDAYRRLPRAGRRSDIAHYLDRFGRTEAGRRQLEMPVEIDRGRAPRLSFRRSGGRQPADGRVRSLKTMLATFYSDNLSEEVTKGMLEKARGGDAPGKAPIGYLNDRNSKRIIIDPDRAPLVRRAFELYATGNYSLFDIRKALIEMGFALRNGGRPPRTSIELMLKNPFYYGEFRWRGQLFKGNHEPLISRSLFDRVQTKLADKGPGVFQEREFAFGQFMTCGHCGCAITAEIKKEKYIYYRCTNGKGKCPQKYVREEALVGQFAEVVRAVRLDPRLASWIEEAVLEANEDEHRFQEAEVTRLNAEIARLTQRMERIYIDKLDGHIGDELWAKMSAEMKAAKRDAEARLGALGRADQNFKALVQSTLELAQAAHSLFLGETPHQQRELLYHVLSNCKMKDGVVVPEYRKPFALLAHAAKQWDQEKAASGSEDPKAAIRWAWLDSNRTFSTLVQEALSTQELRQMADQPPAIVQTF